MRILITGANRGLGKALAQLGSERGHHILSGVRKITSPEKDSLTIIPLDVTSDESVKQAAALVEKNFGTIDCIINNAGVLLEEDKSMEEIDVEQVKMTFDVNLFGPMRVVKYFLPLLSKNSGSTIINVSSGLGSIHHAYAGNYAYGTSKTALNMFSEQIRQYVKKDRIQVYAVDPGWMQTDMGGKNAPGDPYDTAKGIYDIIEGKTKVDSKFAFIHYEGNSLEL